MDMVWVYFFWASFSVWFLLWVSFIARSTGSEWRRGIGTTVADRLNNVDLPTMSRLEAPRAKRGHRSVIYQDVHGGYQICKHWYTRWRGGVAAGYVRFETVSRHGVKMDFTCLPR